MDARHSFSQEAKARDLSLYDGGGTYDLGWGRGSKALEKARLKLRAFLWEHWFQHRLGRITTTIYTFEGCTETGSFFVEPDERGVWRVAIE